MSIHRHAAKVDSSQGVLVKSLQDVGIRIWSIRKPCDLLLRFWCNRHQTFCWQTLEVKTAQGKIDPKPRRRSDQSKQEEFLRETDTPIATDFDSAWRELNKRHTLGRIDVPCILNPVV